MAKKSKAPLPQIVVRDPEVVNERIRQAKEAERDKEFDKVNREYMSAMEGAWRRYITALHADTSHKSAGKDYDNKFDQEREAALAAYHRACKILDKISG
jgi:hypothetical protein